MTRVEFDKLDKICETIKVERDRINKLRHERIAQIKEQYHAIVAILADAKVEE